MKNILITGGAGFIGSRLSKKLKEKNYNITILDNLSEQVHGNINSDFLNQIKSIARFIKGDVRNKEDWRKSIKGQDIIVHLAAETGTGQSMYQIEKYNNVNVIGTSNLLDVLSSSTHSVNKILVASSRSVYGEGKYNCVDHGIQYPSIRKEKDLLNQEFNLKCQKCNKHLHLIETDENSAIQPSSIYGVTKQKQEDMIMSRGISLGIPTVALRYQNVYGPGQSLSNPYTGILSIFSTRILNGNDLDIYEDGLESRDFVYINDVVEATILCIEKEEANGEIFNVGSGIPTTVMSVAKSLKKLYKSDIKILISGKFRIGDIRHNFADLSKIKNRLGFTPKISFDTGIVKFVEWVKTQEIVEDKYEDSLKELQKNGLVK